MSQLLRNKPFTELQIWEVKASEKMQRIAYGRLLYVMDAPISKASNSKSFFGEIRFPSARKEK